METCTSKSFMEMLEGRRLLSSVFKIMGGNAPTEHIVVELSRFGIFYGVANSSAVPKLTYRPYSKLNGVREIRITTGDWVAGGGTRGTHIVDVSNDHARFDRITVIGTAFGVNYINVNENNSTPVYVMAGAHALNYLTENGLSRFGHVFMTGGDSSTNYFTFASGYNELVGGSSAANVFSVTALGSSGMITAGNNSSDIVETWDGGFPNGYIGRGDLTVHMKK